MVKISVVLPIYNEEKAVFSVVNTIRYVMDAMPYEYEIIAVNDGSKDRTKDILNQIPGINVINHPYNLGYGSSLKTGIKNSSGDYILMMDADGTYPAETIPALLEHIRDYDMVVGARTGKSVKIPAARKPAKYILTALAKVLTGKHIPDLNSGMRIFKKEIAMEFFHLFPSKFSFTTTITLACLTNDYTVKFVPINYHKRKGKSTVAPNDFVGFANLIIKIITFFNPLKIFTGISLFLFFLALVIFLYGYILTGRVMDITIIVILLASLQIFLFGIIAEILTKTRK